MAAGTAAVTLALLAGCGSAAHVNDSAASTVTVTQPPSAPQTGPTTTPAPAGGGRATSPRIHAPRPPRKRATVTVHETAPMPSIIVTVVPPAEPAPTVSDGNGPLWPGTSLSTSLSSAYRWDVALVQRRLNALGYSHLAVDGDYGPITAGVVRSYQSDHGLFVDGVVGPVTWRSLFQWCYCG
jgi:putative peptidoglycan binding protein